MRGEGRKEGGGAVCCCSSKTSAGQLDPTASSQQTATASKVTHACIHSELTHTGRRAATCCWAACAWSTTPRRAPPNSWCGARRACMRQIRALLICPRTALRALPNPGLQEQIELQAMHSIQAFPYLIDPHKCLKFIYATPARSAQSRGWCSTATGSRRTPQTAWAARSRGTTAPSRGCAGAQQGYSYQRAAAACHAARAAPLDAGIAFSSSQQFTTRCALA